MVGDVPEVVEATCCTLGPPRPFVITTLALANEVPGNGEAVAEAAGVACRGVGRAAVAGVRT